MADFAAKEARRVVDEVKRQQANAAEYAGNAGAARKRFLEESGLTARVFGIGVAADKMELDKRAEFYRGVLRFGLKLGHLGKGSQIDAFDDINDIMREILAEHGAEKATEQAAPKDETLDDLVNGAETADLVDRAAKADGVVDLAAKRKAKANGKGKANGKSDAGVKAAADRAAGRAKATKASRKATEEAEKAAAAVRASRPDLN